MTIFGLGYEVYLINLVIAIPTFFIIRWLIRRITKEKTLGILIPWIGTLFLTPLIYVCFVIMIFYVITYEPSRNFNKERWFSDTEKRYEMRDDIVKSKILLGKTKSEIIELIGRPGKGDSTNVWNYDLGMSGNGFGWQFNNIELTFIDNIVSDIKKIEIKD